MKSNLITRAITGALFVAVMVGGILYNWMSFTLLFALITGLATWELCTILNRRLLVRINRSVTTLSCVYLHFAIFSMRAGISGSESLVPMVVPLLYLMISELYRRNDKAVLTIAFTFFPHLYIALPFALLYFFEPMTCYPILTLSVFLFLWMNDTGAYLVGSSIGRHRLFPSVSPKKSWEGSIGGGIIAVGVSQLLAFVFFRGLWSADALTDRLCWAGLAVVVVVFGTWGDLVESMLKRRLDIKDSGNILPGHGGMLDRFDSSLLAIPAAVLYAYTLRSIGI